MVNSLANQYRNQPVVFVEHDVDDNTHTGNRKRRWYDAQGGSSSTLPMVMTDSGFNWTEGSVNFQLDYKKMVDASLRESAEVAIQAWQERIGIESRLRVHGHVTNIGARVLGYDNRATLNVIVYEDRQVIHVNRFVRNAVSVDIDPDLAPGQRYHFDLQVGDLGRANMSKVRAIVLVDYRPGDGSVDAWRSANAAVASTDAPPPTEEPTEEPTPTREPTATPPATDEPPPTPETPDTPEPTAPPTPTEQGPDTGATIFLPLAKNDA